MNLPWAQLSQLGLGGSIVITVLWMVFKFLSQKKNGTDKIMLRIENSELKTANATNNMASAIEKLSFSIDNQTNFMKRMHENYVVMSEDIKEIKSWQN